MRELNEAIEIGCRAIETAMRNAGQQMSFHMRNVDVNRELNPVPTDLAGNFAGYQPGHMRVSVTLDGAYLGEIPESKRRQRDDLRVSLVTPGKPEIPNVVADIPDAGYRAGVKALLEKFQIAIKNATEIAEGGEPTGEYRRLLGRTQDLRPDDIAVKLVQSVLNLRDDVRSAEQSAAKAKQELEANPERQLQARLKLKMKANYTEQRDVLREFQNFILDNYSAHFPDARPDAVEEFLEQVGETR